MQVKYLSSTQLEMLWTKQSISMQWVVCKHQALLKTNDMVCGENLEAREMDSPR